MALDWGMAAVIVVIKYFFNDMFYSCRLHTAALPQASRLYLAPHKAMRIDTLGGYAF